MRMQIAAKRRAPVWLVIFVGATVLAISIGVRQTFGLYLTPISENLSAGREVFALAIGLQNLIWGFGAPVAGALSDKFGAGRVVALGAIFYVAGVCLMATAMTENDLFASGVLIGIGISGTGYTVILGAVGRAVRPERRARALGLAAMGGSIGQFLALPYAHLLISAVGWVSSLFVLAATISLILLLAVGVAGAYKAPDDVSEQSWQGAVGEACKHKGFVLLNAGFFVCGFQITFVVTHLPAFLVDHGLGVEIGVLALTVIGASNIAGTYIWSRIGERIENKVALTILYLLRGCVFLAIIVFPVNAVTILSASAALGFLWLGTFPLTSSLVAALFGPKWMSMLFGIVFFTHQLGAFLGAWLGGYVYTIFGSYELMWWLAVALSGLAGLLHLAIVEVPAHRMRLHHA
jgi:MFS family permease